MSRPLPFGDPTRLGPFRLTARLDESPAGIVFLGVADDGRSVSVAVLTRGAAEDAAARDRFRAAVTAALPPSATPGLPSAIWSPARGPRNDPGGEPRVVAAEPDGPAPWVATEYDPGHPGAERFLDAVLFTGAFRDRWTGGRRGPQFQPYWADSTEAATAPPRGPAAPVPSPIVPRPVRRSLASAVLGLAAMLAVLALLLVVLFACRPSVEPPPPSPPTDVPSRRSTTPQPSPTLSPSPTPTPTPRSPRPSPSRTGDDEGAPA